MTNFYEGGRGLCLPDQTVETLHATSLRKKQRPHQRKQDVPHTPLYDNVFMTGGRKHSAPTIVLILIFICCLFNNATLAQSRDTLGAVDGVGEIVPLMVGQKVPEEFWMKEHLFYVNGDTVRRTLEEYRGKLLVLDFWATWCGICLHQMKDKEQLLNKYPSKTKLLMTNSMRTKDSYQNIAQDQDKLSRMSATGYFESIIEDHYIQQIFPVYAYPTYYWISPAGNFIASTMGLSLSGGHLDDLIKQLIWPTKQK